MEQLLYALNFLHAKSVVYNALVLKSLLLILTTPFFIKLLGFEHSCPTIEARGGKIRPRLLEAFEALLKINMI